MKDRVQNLKNWQLEKREKLNLMIDPDLFKSHNQNQKQYAILHDNVGAINRYFESFQISDEYSLDNLNKNPDPIVPNTNARFFGRRLTFNRHSFLDSVDIIYISTNMGSPNTAMVIHELKAFDIKKIIKIGTASGLNDELEDGDVLVPSLAAADEGTSKWNNYNFLKDVDLNIYFSNIISFSANNDLRKKLIENVRILNGRKFKIYTANNVAVWSVDSYPTFIICTDVYSPLKFKNGIFDLYNRSNVHLLGVEMECGSLFSTAKMLKMQAASIIIISRTRREMEAPTKGWKNISRNSEIVRYSELKCMEAATQTLLSIRD